MMSPGEITIKSYRTTPAIALYLWVTFIICFLSNIMAGSVSTIMSVYLPVVVRDLSTQTDPGQMSRVSSLINTLYLAGWTLGGFVWGTISDRIGRSLSLAISMTMFGLFTGATSAVSSLEIIMIFRFLTGFGVGGTMVLNTLLLAESWPERSRSIFIGFLSIGFPIGIISSGTINYMVTDWRMGFLSGLIPFLIGLISFKWLRESDKWKNAHVERRFQVQPNLLKSQRSNLINGSIIFGCMLIGLWAVFSWLPTWIQSLLSQADGSKERGLGMMLMGTGGLAGGFISGWVSRSLGTRRSMMIVFAGSFLLSILLFKVNVVFSTMVLVEIALLAILFGISQGLLGYYIPLLFPVSVRGAATGFCFNTGRVITTLAVLLVGWLVTALGGYGNSLFTFSFVFLAGFIVLYYSKNIVK